MTGGEHGMREVTFPTLTAFHPDMQRSDKQQIVKILEETAELSVAANDYRKGEGSRDHMADELADVLQTLANFVDAYRLTDDEIAAAVERGPIGTKRGVYDAGQAKWL
jgi:NTP pyrophosphatase (non-canonical NTP hydrolase)